MADHSSDLKHYTGETYGNLKGGVAPSPLSVTPDIYILMLQALGPSCSRAWFLLRHLITLREWDFPLLLILLFDSRADPLWTLPLSFGDCWRSPLAEQAQMRLFL